MRKKKLGILLTISLSKELYKQVKLLSEKHEISMAEVVRNSITSSLNCPGLWFTAKPKLFTAEKNQIPAAERAGHDLEEDLQKNNEQEEVDEKHAER